MKMQNMFLSVRSRLVASAVLLAVLAACGGGGGGTSTPTAAAAITAAEIASASSLPFEVLGAEELAAFNLLNFERERCGFAVMTRDASLDAAAKAHADYQLLNSVVTHTESSALSGFSGTLPSDRVLAKGYSGAGGVTDEIVGLMGTGVQKTGAGVSGIRGLLSAPYHLRGLMGGYRDIGLSVRASTDMTTPPGATPTVILQIDAAYKSTLGPQLPASTSVNTYPCEGTSGVNRQLSNESPNPVKDRDLSVNPLGAVVYVAVRQGNVLSITSASMIQMSNGQAVPLRAPVTAATDPYGPCSEGCYKRHEAYVAADVPLVANTAYQMVITGTNSGTAFSRSFVFTTGVGG